MTRESISTTQRTISAPPFGWPQEVDTKAKSINGPALWNGKTAAEHARFQGIRTMDEGEPEEGDTRRKKNGLLIADLLDSFEADPDVTI